MSKSKSASKSSKPATANVLTKVKDGGVTKPAQKVKSAPVTKATNAKEEKKSKKSKKVKEPTPEPESESESESESSESESEASESSEDEEVKPIATNGKKASESSDEESDSSDEEEAPANGVLGKAPAVTEVESDEDDNDSDSSAESEEESKPSKPATSAKAVKADSSDEDSDGDSDSGDESTHEKAAANDDSSDSSDSSEDEAETKPPTTKRKAQEDVEPVAKKTKTAESAAPQSANLFVGSLSWNVDEAWLKETFEEHGEISRVQVMTDRATGRSKGFGYVEFVKAEDAAAAHAAKQGFLLDNRAINVDFANARPPKPDQADRRKSYGDQVSEPSDTLFLGNLSFDVGQETVTESFSPHGTIMGIRLPTDRETGEPKGFGYVTFASVDEAKAALEAMQGSYIGGRPVRLDFSQPRPQNDAGGGRGGRGGFGGRGRGGDRGGRGRGGFGGGRGRGGFDRGGRGGGRGGSTNRGGFGDFSGKKVSFD